MANLTDVLNFRSNLTGADIKSLYEAEPNAFTDADKTKLAGIADGAEVNVNADWNAVDGDALILNKPTLGTAAATNSTDYATAAQGALADTALQPGDVGVTVQGYDANTAKYDVNPSNFAGVVQGTRFISTQATGTAPFSVSSTTVVPNLNADLLDGNEASAFATSAQGTLADTAIQPGDNVSELTNDAQYLNATTLASTSVEIDCGDFTNPV